MNQRFRQLRKELGLTQVELGKVIGVSGAAIARIEAGAYKPTEASIKLICTKFHVNYNWLTEGQGDMMEDLDTDALVEKYMVGESEWAKSVMKSFAKLPDEEWRRFRDMIERIKKEGHP